MRQYKLKRICLTELDGVRTFISQDTVVIKMTNMAECRIFTKRTQSLLNSSHQ